MNIFIENIIFDVPILFSAFIFFIKGWNKGVVRTFMNFVVWMLSFIFSGVFSFYLSSFIYRNFIKKEIVRYFYKICSTRSIETIPHYLVSFFKLCGINCNTLSKMIFEVNSGEILCNVVSPYLINFIRFIIGSFIFGIVIAVLKKISNTSYSVFSIPILSQFNSFLGACLGLLKGAFIIWGISLFLKVSLIYWNNPPEIFSQNAIQCTSIFSKFYNFNPLTVKFLDNFSLDKMGVIRCLMQ